MRNKDRSCSGNNLRLVSRVGEEHREAARRRSWQKREVDKMEEERKAYWHAYVRGITARRGQFIS